MSCCVGLLSSKVKHAASQQAVKSRGGVKLREGVGMAAYLVMVRLSVKGADVLQTDLTWSQNRVVPSLHVLHTDPLGQKSSESHTRLLLEKTQYSILHQSMVFI